MSQPDALYELARHAGRAAGTTSPETAAFLRSLTDDSQPQVAGWLDGLGETRLESLEWPLPLLTVGRASLVVTA